MSKDKIIVYNKSEQEVHLIIDKSQKIDNDLILAEKNDKKVIKLTSGSAVELVKNEIVLSELKRLKEFVIDKTAVIERQAEQFASSVLKEENTSLKKEIASLKEEIKNLKSK